MAVPCLQHSFFTTSNVLPVPQHPPRLDAFPAFLWPPIASYMAYTHRNLLTHPKPVVLIYSYGMWICGFQPHRHPLFPRFGEKRYDYGAYGALDVLTSGDPPEKGEVVVWFEVPPGHARLCLWSRRVCGRL